MVSGLVSSTVKWLRCTIVSYCIVLYREASKHKELCNGATQGDTAGHALRSLQGGEDGAHGTISQIERCLMHRMVIIIAALLVVGLTQAAAAADASTSADNRKTEKSKQVNSVRVDVSSAGPERPSSQEPAKQKKRVDSVRVDVSSAP